MCETFDLFRTFLPFLSDKSASPAAAAAAAAAMNVRDDRARELVQGASSTKTDPSPRLSPRSSDSLSDWIEQRQKSFWDFEKSFFQQPFDARPAFPAAAQPQRLSVFSRPFFDSTPDADVDIDIESDFFRRRSRPKMLSTRHNAAADHDEDMSPKAKVTYDEDKFQVKLLHSGHLFLTWYNF